jgi:2-phosphosulfolactate phosphatase
VARRVGIGCFREHLDPEDQTATVAVDVLRATTTAITAVARGRRCYPVPSLAAALARAAELDHPLLAGELDGVMPAGFHLQNSPAALHGRADVHRPLVLLSTSGTPLMRAAGRTPAGYAACLRNVTAQAEDLTVRPDDVRLLGADSRGEFRDEDQLCCARIATRLLDAGFEPRDHATEAVIERWARAPDAAVGGGRSARYLIATGQRADLDFTRAHIDDLEAVFPLVDGELEMRPAS